jgi:hypothetical protein
MNFFFEDLIRRYELMSVTEIKNGKRNGSMGVMNFPGRIKYKTAATENSINEKNSRCFNKAR